MWRNIKRILQAHHSFLITTHVNPDGDGVGSACAMIELLLHMRKKVRFVTDSPIPRKLDFLDYYHNYEVYDPQKNYDDIQVMIVLDTHKKARIGPLAVLAEKSSIICVCIDHHEAVEQFTPHLIIDPTACSVGAMVYTIYKESGFDLNIRAATGIYTSVICDTGRFCYSSTGRKAHKIAEECIKLGVDPDLMYSRLYQHVTLAESKILAKALEGMETYLDNQLAIQQIRKEDCEKCCVGSDLEHVDLDYIHDFNNMIEDVRCFVLLRELANGQVRVSLRSKHDLNINSIVRQMGGGGHPNAAGFTWQGSLEEVKKMILNKVDDLLKKTNTKPVLYE